MTNLKEEAKTSAQIVLVLVSLVAMIAFGIVSVLAIGQVTVVGTILFSIVYLWVLLIASGYLSDFLTYPISDSYTDPRKIYRAEIEMQLLEQKRLWEIINHKPKV